MKIFCPKFELFGFRTSTVLPYSIGWVAFSLWTVTGPSLVNTEQASQDHFRYKKKVLYIKRSSIQWNAEIRQRRNPNDQLFEQLIVRNLVVQFTPCSDFSVYSTKYSGMPKSKRSNRLVRLSGINLCLKSEQSVQIWDVLGCSNQIVCLKSENVRISAFHCM